MAFVVPSLKNRLPESLPYPFRGTVVCSAKLPGIRESAESVFFPGMSWKHFPVAAGMILVFGGMFTFSRQRCILKVDSENKNVTCVK